VASLPQILVGGPQFPANTVAEMTSRWPRPSRARLSFASVGNGSPGHLAGELQALRTGTQMTHIPYRAAARPSPT
jgi:tripartite-type tricarboxylate transporter receptor subunit TctC